MFMILLNRTLSKLEISFITVYINHLLNSIRDEKTTKAITNSAIKEFSPLAIAGQVESVEQYCNYLPQNAKFDSGIFGHICRFNNMPKKSPEVLMALSAYYKWKSGEIEISSKTNGLENSSNTSSLNKSISKKFYDGAMEMINRPTFYNLDPLAQAYIFNQIPSEKIDSSLLIQMSNYRNNLLTAISKLISGEKKFKYTFAFLDNLIRYASPTEFKKYKHIISSFFSEAQKPSFKVVDLASLDTFRNVNMRVNVK